MMIPLPHGWYVSSASGIRKGIGEPQECEPSQQQRILAGPFRTNQEATAEANRRGNEWDVWETNPKQPEVWLVSKKTTPITPEALLSDVVGGPYDSQACAESVANQLGFSAHVWQGSTLLPVPEIPVTSQHRMSVTK